MARPIENDNGKRLKLLGVYTRGGAPAALREAARLQISASDARGLVAEWDAEPIDYWEVYCRGQT